MTGTSRGQSQNTENSRVKKQKEHGLDDIVKPPETIIPQGF